MSNPYKPHPTLETVANNSIFALLSSVAGRLCIPMKGMLHEIPASMILAGTIMFYAFWAMFMMMLQGASQASVEGGLDVNQSRWNIIVEISPIFPYLFAMILYGVTALFRYSMKIELAVQRLAEFHLGFFLLFLMCILITVLVPPGQLSDNDFYMDPMRHLLNAQPFLMLSVLIFYLFVGAAREQTVDLIKAHPADA